MTIEVGSAVVLYLAAPREQVFGVILSLGPAGVVLRGISLASLDDWLRTFADGEAWQGGGLGLATSFYPMHRVERVSLDEDVGGIEPIQRRFHARTGLSIHEFVGVAEPGEEDADPDPPR